jgi:uncharacterized protein YlxW (UPF0749 family)
MAVVMGPVRRRLRRLVPAGAGRSRNASRDAGQRRASHLVAALASALIGLLVVTSALTSRANGQIGPERENDLRGLVREQADRNRDLQQRQAQLQGEVNALSNTAGNAQTKALQSRAAELGSLAGLTPVSGPGIRVTLDDAPRAAHADGVDVDALVVHQQDIQAVVNALWAGGARGVSIQAQRLISTSAIRCVGNSVVVEGVPYPPPYVIEAVGDQGALEQALSESPAITIYQQYVVAYGLGYSVERDAIKLPGYTGPIALSYAQPR